MATKTEKKLELLENDVTTMEEKHKEFAERLRKKKLKAEEIRNLAIVEIVRENNISITELKTILNNSCKFADINSPLEIPGELTGANKNETIKNGKEENNNELENI